MNTEKMNIIKRIAIVAHENSKNDLIEWSFNNRETLKRHEIVAAGYTADVLEGTLNISITKLLTASLGGYAQLGNMIVDGKIDVIIFLGYPKKTEPVDIDMRSLLKLADEKDLVIALNKQTAEVILSSAFLDVDEESSFIDSICEQKEAI